MTAQLLKFPEIKRDISKTYLSLGIIRHDCGVTPFFKDLKTGKIVGMDFISWEELYNK